MRSGGNVTAVLRPWHRAHDARSDTVPALDHSSIVDRVAGIGLYVVSGITLWLLLARRKRVAARWVFVGYFVVQMFLRHLFFSPI